MSRIQKVDMKSKKNKSSKLISESSSNRTLSLSYDGELFKAPHKKYQETVLLVPFFQGKKINLKRHIEWLNEIGFDCVFFDLKDEWHEVGFHLFTKDNRFGMKHVWTEQIETLLSEIPDRKIIFSFSNPSASAIETIARCGAKDIAGFLCDSGPSGSLNESMIRYFTVEEPIPFYPVKWVASWAVTLLWHPNFKKVIHQDLKKFPKGFRVLSIRGWKDPLITPQMIDQLFEPHSQIDWQKLSLPEAGHLNGLKDFRDQYVEPVARFLKEISTAI